MPLERKRCGLELKLASDTETEIGTFEGYGAVFGNNDSYNDVIAKGAFKDTLKSWKKKKKLPAMLLQHGGMFGPAEDGIPVGIYGDMFEDDIGLYCKGKLFALDTDKGKYIHEGLKAGALDGLSIGYEAREVAYGKTPEEPYRTLKKIDLWEVSIVTFPANDEARVGSAKSISALTDITECEAYLRDVCRLSKSQARALISQIKSHARCDAGDSLAEAKNLTQRIQRLTGESP